MSNYTLAGALVRIFDRFFDTIRHSKTSAMTQAYGVATILFVIAGYGSFKSSGYATTVTIIVLGFLVILTGLFVQYLSGKSRTSRSMALSSEQTIEARLIELENARSAAVGVTLGESDRARLVESLQAKLNEETGETILEDLRKRIALSLEAGIIEERMRSSVDRLNEEVEALSKRGNLNLAIGIVTTLAGLLVLGYAVYHPPGAYVYTTELSDKTTKMTTSIDKMVILHYASRASLALFVELFALFFLRLYKASLEGIRYFQNEITNLESKFLAVTVAKLGGDSVLIGKLLTKLVETERNRVLTKNQTTIELEQAKLDAQGVRDALKAVTNNIKERADAARH